MCWPLVYIDVCTRPLKLPSSGRHDHRIADSQRRRRLLTDTVLLLTRAVDDQILSPEEEASFNVDALVNDSVGEKQVAMPPFGSQLVESPRRATPSIPPGFSAPAEVKSITKEPQPIPMSRKASSTITPAVPVVPATPAQAQMGTPTKTKKGKQAVVLPEDSPGVDSSATNAAVPVAPTTPARTSRKPSIKAAETPKKKSVEPLPSGQKENSPASTTTPVKATPKGRAISRKGEGLPESSPRKDAKDVPQPSTPTSSKRQHPGKLDIAAATKVAETDGSSLATSAKPDSQSKPVRAMATAVAQSVPVSPAAIATGSPMKKSTGAKTLRVVATPKIETPPPLSAISLTSLPQVPNVEKLRSRQASIASLNQPGTPASELISDTASITSTSISRANSPPPLGGKVGTAPIRKKTKSQQKKDRQERARQAEEERVIAMDEQKSEPEVVQAPIVGRKKKAKKPATSNPKPVTAPAKSRPVTPKPVQIEEEEEQVESTPPPPVLSKKAPAVKAPSPPPRFETADTFEHTGDRREPTAQSVLADLQKTGELIASTLEFFKPLSSSLTHAPRSAQTSGGPVAPPDLKIHFSEADLDALSKKKPVRLNGHDGRPDSRTLITPQGKFFWGLTQELEEKALELEKHIEELKGAARFHARKQTAHQQHAHLASQSQSKDMLPALATALKEAGAKLGKGAGQPIPKIDPTSALLGSSQLPLPPVQALNETTPPQPPQQQQTPADAGTYLNQFVLPKTDNPSPNAPRPEMAAVGGLPGAGTAQASMNVNKIAKAAKAVAEGKPFGSELDGMGVMAADLLGGVFVQGLEALVGAGLSMDREGFAAGLDVQGLVNAFEAGGGFGAGRKGGRGVLNIDEAEQAMLAARRDHDALEKKLAGIQKRNKKVVSGGR
jgi:hypothetical protein